MPLIALSSVSMLVAGAFWFLLRHNPARRRKKEIEQELSWLQDSQLWQRFFSGDQAAFRQACNAWQNPKASVLDSPDKWYYWPLCGVIAVLLWVCCLLADLKEMRQPKKPPTPIRPNYQPPDKAE